MTECPLSRLWGLALGRKRAIFRPMKNSTKFESVSFNVTSVSTSVSTSVLALVLGLGLTVSGCGGGSGHSDSGSESDGQTRLDAGATAPDGG